MSNAVLSEAVEQLTEQMKLNNQIQYGILEMLSGMCRSTGGANILSRYRTIRDPNVNDTNGEGMDAFKWKDTVGRTVSYLTALPRSDMERVTMRADEIRHDVESIESNGSTGSGLSSVSNMEKAARETVDEAQAEAKRKLDEAIHEASRIQATAGADAIRILNEATDVSNGARNNAITELSVIAKHDRDDAEKAMRAWTDQLARVEDVLDRLTIASRNMGIPDDWLDDVRTRIEIDVDNGRNALMEESGLSSAIIARLAPVFTQSLKQDLDDVESTIKRINMLTPSTDKVMKANSTLMDKIHEIFDLRGIKWNQ